MCLPTDQPREHVRTLLRSEDELLLKDGEGKWGVGSWGLTFVCLPQVLPHL